MAQIDILNTGHGHAEIKFDVTKTEEVDKARRAVVDMLKRGYVLLIHAADGSTVRVKSFDPKINCYIIDDIPELVVGDEDEPEECKAKAPKGKRAVPMGIAKVTAVGRSAGG